MILVSVKKEVREPVGWAGTAFILVNRILLNREGGREGRVRGRNRIVYFDTYCPALLFFVETTSQFDFCVDPEEAWGG